MRKSPDIDRLEAKVRELKSVIRSLQKRVKKLSKGKKRFIEEEFLDESPLEICPECGKGELKEINIMNRIFFRCTLCGHRGKK